jgi:hypothetical protein
MWLYTWVHWNASAITVAVLQNVFVAILESLYSIMYTKLPWFFEV